MTSEWYIFVSPSSKILITVFGKSPQTHLKTRIFSQKKRKISNQLVVGSWNCRTNSDNKLKLYVLFCLLFPLSRNMAKLDQTRLTEITGLEHSLEIPFTVKVEVWTPPNWLVGRVPEILWLVSVSTSSRPTQMWISTWPTQQLQISYIL